MAQGILDRVSTWTIDRYAHVRNEWVNKIGKPERGTLLSTLLGAGGFSDNPNLNSLDSNEKQRQALTVSWIYADIQLIAREFSAAKIAVKRLDGEKTVDVRNHEFERLLARPNTEIDLTFLWQYTVAWLSLRGDGYWFLAPEMGDPNKLAEIWPLRADRITPLITKEEFVAKYQYTSNTGQKILIDPKYVVHFMYPNPYSLYKGLSPFQASIMAMDTEVGTGSFQKDYYTSGRGIPASIIMLNEDMSDRDFNSTVAQIRDDFEQERKVVIARGGDLKVATVGLTQREMQLVDQRNFTRDELDVIFLGVALHRKSTEAELKQMDKMFKEKTIHPLHTLLAGQLNVQVMQKFYSEDEVIEFEDIRAQDKALNVQERNVYWRAKTLNEARQDLGLPPLEDEELGNMLVALATDPAFVAMLKGLSRVDKNPGSAGGLSPDSPRRLPSANASMSESDAPVNQMSDAAAGFKGLGLDEVKPGIIIEGNLVAEETGLETELKRWQKVSVKEANAGRKPFQKKFSTDILPQSIVNQVIGGLWESGSDVDAVKALFDSIKADLRGGNRGRPDKATKATNDYQKALEKEYEEWADEISDEASKKDNAEDKKAVILAGLALLLLSLQTLGRKTLPDALFLAVGDGAPTPELLQFMANAVAENETYLAGFIADLRAKIERAFADSDIILALNSGVDSAKQVLVAVLATSNARISMYAGWFHRLYQYAYGVSGDNAGKKYRWNLENGATHCRTCLEFGDTTYPSFAECLAQTGSAPGLNVDCKANCRCSGEFV